MTAIAQLPALPVRFFALGYVQDGPFELLDEVEVSEKDFLGLAAQSGVKISYARHTVRENGVSQVCLSVDATIGD